MSDKTASTSYTFAEAKVLIGPLVGWPPEDVSAFVVVTLDSEGRAGFGASPGIEPQEVPRILRTMAKGIQEAVES